MQSVRTNLAGTLVFVAAVNFACSGGLPPDRDGGNAGKTSIETGGKASGSAGARNNSNGGAAGTGAFAGDGLGQIGGAANAAGKVGVAQGAAGLGIQGAVGTAGNVSTGVAGGVIVAGGAGAESTINLGGRAGVGGSGASTTEVTSGGEVAVATGGVQTTGGGAGGGATSNVGGRLSAGGASANTGGRVATAGVTNAGGNPTGGTSPGGTGSGGNGATGGTATPGSLACPTPVAPIATGNLTIAAGYVAVNGIHGKASSALLNDIRVASCMAATDTSADVDKAAICAAGMVASDSASLSNAVFGFNVSETSTNVQHIFVGTITVTIKTFGILAGNSTARIQIFDASNNVYFVEARNWSSGSPIPITSFHTLDGINASTSTQVVYVGMQIPSDPTFDHAFNLCLTDVSVETSTLAACPGNGGAPMVLLPLNFCIDSTEVTRAQYAKWLSTATPAAFSAQDAGTCGWNETFVPDESCMTGSGCRGADCGDYPQVCIDWCDAFAYCNGVGKRLCGRPGQGARYFWDESARTQALLSQWYAACSSNGKYLFAYGNTYDPLACNGSTFQQSLGHDGNTASAIPVASLAGCKTVGPYAGVFDLNGNAMEWEDACSSSNNGGANDSCPVRYSCFTCGGGGECASIGGGILRNSVSSAIGFRCCSP